MIITPTTTQVVTTLNGSTSPPFLVNELAVDIDASWHKTKTAVVKLVDLGLLEIAEQSWTGYTFYQKHPRFNQRLRTLQRQGIFS